MREFMLRAVPPKPVSLPPELLERTNALRDGLVARSAIVWAEHCTECAQPACYSQCEFYTPREDLKCRRFKGGMRPVSFGDVQDPEWFDVHFKKWGKLEGAGTVRLVSPDAAVKADRALGRAERAVQTVAMPQAGKILAQKAAMRLIYRQANRLCPRELMPAGAQVVLETFNHEASDVVLTLTIREKDNPARAVSHRFVLSPGYEVQRLPFATFASVDTGKPCLYAIEPDADATPHVSFGLVDVIVQRASTAPQVAPAAPVPAPSVPVTTVQATDENHKVKCVVFDLDNTLWGGVLIEDGVENLTLKPGVEATLKALDERGILLSIASKNTEADAIAALKHFGLDHLFVYPQISWNPKSAALATIRKSLNIGMDTLVFLDDSPFERAEVGEAHAALRVWPETALEGLLERPAFDVPVTPDSRKRRVMYQENEVRVAAAADVTDFAAFLRSSNMRVVLAPLGEDSLERVYELSQRTNQMNFSGTRYSRAQLKELRGDRSVATYVISAEDRFGSYGTVGFAVVNTAEHTLVDLAFSCRIQAKWVEHHVIEYLATQAQRAGAAQFRAVYRQTPKNTPSGAVFTDMGFTPVDGVEHLLAIDLQGWEPERDTLTLVDETGSVDGIAQ